MAMVPVVIRSRRCWCLSRWWCSLILPRGLAVVQGRARIQISKDLKLDPVVRVALAVDLLLILL
jgi:hypothetical protein